MNKIRSVLAESAKDVRAHLRKRWTIYGKAEGYLPALKPPVSMEFDAFDRLATTRHFIVVISTENRS
ncbi:MAG TPA: hypothetical protein VE093_41730 [Polyangiaceae bacterium]|jgi:hypothetical protein|nr:hypothetical protein [Polyangiaceae bacterium]